MRDMFGNEVTVAEARRLLKAKTPEKRGYAAPPGTGPAGETCRSCAELPERQRRIEVFPEVRADAFGLDAWLRHRHSCKSASLPKMAGARPPSARQEPAMTEAELPKAMSPFLAVFNCHVNNAEARARAVMAEQWPGYLQRVDAIAEAGNGILAVLHDQNPATERFVELVTRFVNEDRAPLANEDSHP